MGGFFNTQKMKNSPITIIAGPCSVDRDNLSEIYEISTIEAKGKRAIAGTRVVGLKSRTGLDQSGAGMGMDFEAYQKNLTEMVSQICYLLHPLPIPDVRSALPERGAPKNLYSASYCLMVFAKTLQLYPLYLAHQLSSSRTAGKTYQHLS